VLRRIFLHNWVEVRGDLGKFYKKTSCSILLKKQYSSYEIEKNERRRHVARMGGRRGEVHARLWVGILRNRNYF
jgi:hypothetical protein